jgi:pimeloyl-ACP methyl ester carboxylesterase
MVNLEGQRLRPELLVGETRPIDDRFDLRQIACAVEHCRATYRDPRSYHQQLTAAGFEGAEILDEAAAQAGLAWSEKVIVVALRGSSEPRDWWDDLTSQVRVGWKGFLPTRGPQNWFGLQRVPRVGLGFRRQADALVDVILGRVSALFRQYPDARLVLTGHSLGGAIAALLLVALDRYLDRRPHLAVLVDPPRPGNAEFRDHLRSLGVDLCTLIHIVGGEADIVTRLPKSATGARHVGDLLLLESDSLRAFHAWDAWERFKKEHPVGFMRGQWRLLGRFVRGVQAHFPERILHTLYRILRRRNGAE